ncbi:MAG: hypothetical protein CMJ46_09880 [Planctomyces sp.]|nr:hypothetical protein [Planctomyces sp.]
MSGHYQLTSRHEGKETEPARGGYQVPSSVGLAAVSSHSLEQIRRNEQTWDDDEDSSPYRIKKERIPRHEPRREKKHREKSGPPGFFREFYWARMHGVRHLLDNLNEFGYLLCVPFIAMLMIAIIWQNRQLGLTAASGIIAINVVRFYINLIHLAVIPFRNSLTQGTLFFIPPITFYFLYKHWNVMKQGARKLEGPILQIVVAVLVFTFIPFLQSDGGSQDLSLPDRIKKESRELRKETESNTEKLEKFSKKAGSEALEGARDKLEELAPDEKMPATE